MPNIAIALKSEISRLARKEIRAETGSLKKAASQYRSQITALKRRVETLERQLRRTRNQPSSKTGAGTVQETGLRFRPAGSAQHRKRLGLSAREMGLLLDASPLSVYKWETGQSRPRAKHLAAISTVRKMGKRQALLRLAQITSA
jgi:DNA-binding transcriptional regulator YiaG